MEYIENSSGYQDLTRIQVSGLLESIAQDEKCHRIESVELSVLKNSQIISTSTFPQLQKLSLNVDNLDDFCTQYELGLKLYGTQGTMNAFKVLKVLPPVKDQLELLQNVKNLNVRPEFSSETLSHIKNVTVSAMSADSVILQWAPESTQEDSKDCIGGLYVELKDKFNKVLESKTVTNIEENEVKFDNLLPCSNYLVKIYTFFGLDPDKNEPIFLGTKPHSLKIKTLPDLSKPFQLKTLSGKITKKSLTVVWDQDELDQCISVKDLQFSVCHQFLNRGSCLQNKTGDVHVEPVDKFYKLEFGGLEPCTDYQV